MSTAMHDVEARERFRRSVTQAQMADLLGLITGGEHDLVSYDQVANRVRARQQIERGTQMVPLEQIVGSVGRYRDFTRTFLPRAGVNQERWTRLDAALNSMEGFPPVELFKIGEVYFVKDGNHRVSVARANGATHIEAYVTELETDIPLTLDDFERDQWIIKAEHKEFMDRTHLDELRPNHGIRFTEPGRYEMALRHIEVHRYFRDLELERAGSEQRLTWEEAVASWYDNVYLPMVEAIREYDLMRNFPERTEADLYMWIAHHRERLAAAYGLAPLSPAAAVATFAQVYSDALIQRTVKGLLLGLHRVLGDDRPLGMSEEEFRESRARHDAGEISLGEAEQHRLAEQRAAHEGHNGHAAEPAHDGHAQEVAPAGAAPRFCPVPEEPDPVPGGFGSLDWQPPTGPRPEL
jgi:hypothetical protein